MPRRQVAPDLSALKSLPLIMDQLTYPQQKAEDALRAALPYSQDDPLRFPRPLQGGRSSRPRSPDRRSRLSGPRWTGPQY